MQLAAHTFGFVWQESAEAALEAVAAAGFRHVQLMAAPPHFDPWRSDAARTTRLQGLIEQYGLNLLACDLASSDINLASASPDVVSFSVDAYRRLIARCADLGAAAVCVGSGRRHALLAKANDRLMESFRPAFREIVVEARRHGLSVGLENHPQGLLADAGAILRFIADEGYADVTVIYDVANAVAIGEDPVEGLAALAPHLSIVHLSDSPIGQWRHDPIGSGAIDFTAIGQELKRQGYKGPVALEILSETPLAGLLDGARKLIEEGWVFNDTLARP
ncbi:sugar phosphate isomerase/epimerase family protein [Bosea vestrisii]|uniref:sugar phosphate isomerase/epimerase family protein n=1 Tax=Bosea vestrisii TaxID=151416 RepID=UPI0024E028D1|nr:sugar phosphate isomerase/epimerase family protein [Bosea vestrisii]WID96663.1 sugar phosphate isomerase/epimerase family protein [Bosea vestrisii]